MMIMMTMFIMLMIAQSCMIEVDPDLYITLMLMMMIDDIDDNDDVDLYNNFDNGDHYLELNVRRAMGGIL